MAIVARGLLLSAAAGFVPVAAQAADYHPSIGFHR